MLITTLIFAAGSAAITLCVTLGPPFLDDIYFVRLHTGRQATPSWPPNSTVRFGVFGWSNSTAHFGYDIRKWGGPGFSDPHIKASLAHATRALFFHPATAACASIALIGALIAILPSRSLRQAGLSFVLLFSIIGSFFSGCGFTVDFIVWSLIRARLAEKSIGRSTHLGPASYVMVAGTICSTLAAVAAVAAFALDSDESDVHDD